MADSIIPTSAPAVSALLRRNGLNPVGTRRREGIYVSRSFNGVSVTVSIDNFTRRERELADMVEAVLRIEGYTFTRTNNILHVKGRADLGCPNGKGDS